MGEFRGAAAAFVLFVLPFLASIAVGRFAGRGRLLAGAIFFVAVVVAVAIAHALTDRNRAGYHVLVVAVEVPLGVGALVTVAAGTIAGLALGMRWRRAVPPGGKRGLTP